MNEDVKWLQLLTAEVSTIWIGLLYFYEHKFDRIFFIQILNFV